MSATVLPSHQVNLRRKAACPLETSSSGYSSGASPNMDLRREQAVYQAVASPPAQPSKSVAAAMRGHEQVMLERTHPCLDSQHQAMATARITTSHQQALQQHQLWQHQAMIESVSIQATAGGAATMLACNQSSSSSVNGSPPTRASGPLEHREEPTLPSMVSERTLRSGPSATKAQHLAHQEGQPKFSATAWKESAPEPQPRQAQSHSQLQHRDDDEAASQQAAQLARNSFRQGSVVTFQQHQQQTADQLMMAAAGTATGAMTTPMALTRGGTYAPDPGMAEAMIPVPTTATHMAYGGDAPRRRPLARQLVKCISDTEVGRLGAGAHSSCMVPCQGANMAVGRHVLMSRQESCGMVNEIAPGAPPPQQQPAGLLLPTHRQHSSEFLSGSSPMAALRQSVTGDFVEGCLAMNAFQADFETQPQQYQLLQRRMQAMTHQQIQQQQQREQLLRQHQQQQQQQMHTQHHFLQAPERRQQQMQQQRCAQAAYPAETPVAAAQQQQEPPQQFIVSQQQQQQALQPSANGGLPLFNFVDPADMDAQIRAKLGLVPRRSHSLVSRAPAFGTSTSNNNQNTSNGMLALSANGALPSVQPSGSFTRDSMGAAELPLTNTGTGSTFQAMQQAMQQSHLLGTQHPNQRAPANGFQPGIPEVPPPSQHRAMAGVAGPVEGGPPASGMAGGALGLAASRELLPGSSAANLQAAHRIGAQQQHALQHGQQQQQDLSMQQQQQLVIRQMLLQRRGQGSGSGPGGGLGPSGMAGFMAGCTRPFPAAAEMGAFGSGGDVVANAGNGSKKVCLPMDRACSAPQADTQIAAKRLCKLEKFGIMPSEFICATSAGSCGVGPAPPVQVAPTPMLGRSSCGRLGTSDRAAGAEEQGLCSEGGRHMLGGSSARALKRPAMERMAWSEPQGPLQHQHQEQEQQYTLQHQLRQQRQQQLQAGWGAVEPQEGGAGLGGSGCGEAEAAVDSGVVQPHKRRLFGAGEITTGPLAVPAQRTASLQRLQLQQGHGPQSASQSQGMYQEPRSEWACRSHPGDMRGMGSDLTAAAGLHEDAGLSGPNGSQGGSGGGRQPALDVGVGNLACGNFGGNSNPPQSVPANMCPGGSGSAKMTDGAGMADGSDGHYQPADVSCQLGGGRFHNEPVYSGADGRRTATLCGAMNPLEYSIDGADGTSNEGPSGGMLTAGCGDVSQTGAALGGADSCAGGGRAQDAGMMGIAALGAAPPDPVMPETDGDILSDPDLHSFIAALCEPGGPEPFRKDSGGPEAVLATGEGGVRAVAMIESGVSAGAMSSDARRGVGAETGGCAPAARGGGGGGSGRLTMSSLALDEEQRALQSEAEVLLDFKFD